MSDPVTCPSCGLSFDKSPADGKCPNCGDKLPGAKGAEGIDEELSRLGPERKACPTCGKPLPAGKNRCPFCAQRSQAHVHHGPPAWVTLLLVLAFAAVATAVTVYYVKKWGHEKHERWVTDSLDRAGESARAGKVSDAVMALNAAESQLKWFDEEDEKRSELKSRLDNEKDEVRAVVEARLKDMIKHHQEEEASKFYDAQAVSVDESGALHKLVVDALANRKAVQKYVAAEKAAVKLHDDGKLGDALKDISELRTQLQELVRGKDDPLSEVRKTVEVEQGAWVIEARDKGQALLRDGKLDEASSWFELAKKHVWSTEVALRRSLEETVSYIADRRIVGVVINIEAVRGSKPEDVKKQLADRLERKLGDEGFLMFVLDNPSDPKGSELFRLLVVDYREEATHEYVAATKKIMGTKITCLLKLVNKPDGKVLKEHAPIVAQTGAAGTLGGDEMTEDGLRNNAVHTFWQAFGDISIPVDQLAP